MSTEQTFPPANDSVSWSQWWGTPVERGEPQTLAVWAPIATIYELCGFGAAMSVIPTLWLFLMGITAWQTCVRIKAERRRTF